MDSSTTTTPLTTTVPPKDKLVVIMGATGSGKSRLSLDLATSYFPHAQIINSDKIQIYKGLDVTTIKVPPHERNGVPHHLLDVLDSIDSDFAATDFRSAAEKAISDIVASGSLPIIVGGSNTYIYALLAKNYDPKVDVFSLSESDFLTEELRYDCCFIWIDVALPVLCDYQGNRLGEMIESGMFEELVHFYDPEKEGCPVGLRRAIGVSEFDKFFKKFPPSESEENGKVPGEGSDRVRVEAYEEALREIKKSACELVRSQLRKIVWLRDGGWDLQQVDGTATFEAALAGAGKGELRELWDKDVVKPSVEIVKRFLEEKGL